jgi:hypothetical protein
MKIPLKFKWPETISGETETLGMNLNRLFLGPIGFRLARCHFRSQKILDFQGPPISMALEMYLSASKSLRTSHISSYTV